MDRKVHTRKILELLTFRESDSHLCSVNLKLSEYMQLHMCSIHTNIGNYLRVVNRCMLSIETKDLNKKLVSLAGFNFFFFLFLSVSWGKKVKILCNILRLTLSLQLTLRVLNATSIFTILLIPINFICRFTFIIALLQLACSWPNHIYIYTYVYM